MFLNDLLNFILRLFKKPTGVLPPVSGGSVLVPKIEMDGNWTPYMTIPYETQYTGFDQLNCVTKSGMHCVEAILNYYYKNKLFPIQEMYDLIEKGGYLNDQGYIDLSERFTAKMAGTTKQGLPMDKFWESINRDGFVPKKAWPEEGGRTWEEYYRDIPEEVRTIGRTSAKIFRWIYEVKVNGRWDNPILSDVRTYLKHSPIHFATCLCNRDYAGVLRYTCGSKIYQHAMTLLTIDDYQEVLDQYDPFLRKNELTYPLACIIVAGLDLE